MPKIAVFENMRTVIRAEHECCQAGIVTAVMPIPEYLSSECGMCLLIDEAMITKFVDIMRRAAIQVTIHDKI